MEVSPAMIMEHEADTSGTVVAVCVSSKKGTSKTPVKVVTLVPEHGVKGDAHAGTGHRAVSLLAEESIEKTRAAGLRLSPGDFAENITTRGIELWKLPVGTRLLIDTVQLEVTQIGKECHTGCEIRNLLGDCIMPTEGIFARVLSGGEIRPGAPIRVVTPAHRKRKRAIRAETLAARRALTREQVEQKSAAITEKLKQLPEYNSARALLVYVSSKDNEVDTLALIRGALKAGRKVLVPVTVPATRELTWSALNSLDELEPSTFGIMEPKEGCVRPRKHTEADLAIVPGIAFDMGGHRIGYGGGYYDRFLASFRGETIAIAYELQVYKSLPAEPHDRCVNLVVTEDRIINCR